MDQCKYCELGPKNSHFIFDNWRGGVDVKIDGRHLQVKYGKKEFAYGEIDFCPGCGEKLEDD